MPNALLDVERNSRVPSVGVFVWFENFFFGTKRKFDFIFRGLNSVGESPMQRGVSPRGIKIDFWNSIWTIYHNEVSKDIQITANAGNLPPSFTEIFDFEEGLGVN